ncbi:pyruvate kinase-like protein [Microdochium trichocladiopsis]|uniref:Pyruvate kinase-like protein n=1 Tax=Microdochium trichocladiopsis TaxID=1682393 RepID=A0A9P9BJW2_9PEZI|nr:pyruvate kinase-like protein [Microdochium trichocladiopsis]KAH7018558.1 pyruvate kinase-like protein [Microdochium trichocladiopsis]
MMAGLPAAPLPPTDVLRSLRIGKVKPFPGQNKVRSAINKLPQQGRIYVSPLGLTGDEQQFELHGGPDKALHQYCSAHYPLWNELAPGRESLFKVGGFGENLSAELLHEGNICIGDKFRLGPEVVIQVSEPRQPCYKLNMRFEYKKASSTAQSTGRTGWYYRVLVPGHVQQGDRFELLERLHPIWSVSQVQNFLYHDTANVEASTVLSQLPELSKYIRDIFTARLVNGVENMAGRLEGDRLPVVWRPYHLVEKTDVTRRVKRLVFEVNESHADIEPGQLEFGQFPHVRLQFGPELAFSRAYSVVAGDMRRFELGVARDDNSRGGSVYMHDEFLVGDKTKVAKGSEAPAPSTLNGHGKDCLADTRKHIFIIGGIGITAFLRDLISPASPLNPANNNNNTEIHYAVRSHEEAAYLSLLPAAQTTIYAKHQHESAAAAPAGTAQRLEPKAVIPASPANVAIYCCGPTSLMEECQKLTTQYAYPRAQVHFESFGSAESGTGQPFEVEIKRSGKVLQVPRDKSLLEVLTEVGFDVDSSCLVGNCGSCVVDYSCGGRKERRGGATATTKNNKGRRDEGEAAAADGDSEEGGRSSIGAWRSRKHRRRIACSAVSVVREVGSLLMSETTY